MAESSGGSSDEDPSQKTEEPTQKKLEDARRRGQVPMSREINNWAMLLAGTIVIATFAGWFMGEMRVMLRSFIGGAHQIVGGPGIFHVAEEVIWEVFMLLSLPLLFFVIVAILAPMIQIGPMFSAETIKPKLQKISPLAGLKRLFSTRALMEFAKSLLKLGLVAGVGAVLIIPFYSGVEEVVALPVIEYLKMYESLVLRLMSGILAVMFVVAVIDITYQQYQHAQQMKMSKQEVKDEYKQTEGDPHVKSRLRQLRQEKSKQRVAQAVPEADVVITNPTHFAVALKYDPEKMDAPVCVAKGIDELAQRIRKIAEDNAVTVMRNPPLARALYDTVEIDETIPVEHYRAVAEIISYIFRMKRKTMPS